MPLNLVLQYGADETFLSDSSDSKSGFGASLMFDRGTGFSAGVAYDKDMTISGDIIRGSASVDLGKYTSHPVIIGALYQEADYDGSNIFNSATEKGLILSAELGLTNFPRPAAVYLQYDKTDNLGGLDNNNSNQLVLGGKYMLREHIIAHAYAGYNSADLENGLVILNELESNNEAELVAAHGSADVLAIGGGIEYLF